MLAIKAVNIKKVYSLYENRKDKLKEAFSIFGKKYHKDFYALKGVSFQIQKGECVGIIGLNGSGKSTLLKILTEVINQTEGELFVDGKVSALLELGAGFNPEYSGLENIYLNTMLMGYSKEETDEKLEQILNFADIGNFIYQPVKLYSSGMFVRLAFAIAITVNPDILIIDEALSVGDVFFQQKCYKKIKEFSGKSTILIVSHDLNALTKFCHRILVMDQGKLEFDGEPNAAIAYYYKLKQGHLSVNRQQKVNESFEEIMKDFKIPDKNLYSGKLDVVIERYSYLINGVAFAESCGKDDEIKISMLINSKKNIEDVIIGYQVRDIYGNEVFGETSLTSEVDQYQISKGANIITFKVIWPEVREGDYFITLGIGEGLEVLAQTEQCWINNAIHILATTRGKTIFGLFNHPMQEFSIKKVN